MRQKNRREEIYPEGFPGALVKKKNLHAVLETACSVGDPGSIPGSGRFPGGGNGNPLQYPCLENPMDGGAWGTVVHGVTRVGHDLETKPPNMSW